MVKKEYSCRGKKLFLLWIVLWVIGGGRLVDSELKKCPELVALLLPLIFLFGALRTFL